MPTSAEVVSRAINRNTEELKKIAGFLEKLATPEFVEVPLEDTVTLAKLVGVTGGFAQMMTTILDDPQLDTFKKAQELRTLAGRAQKMSEEFSKELSEKDQARARNVVGNKIENPGYSETEDGFR